MENVIPPKQMASPHHLHKKKHHLPQLHSSSHTQEHVTTAKYLGCTLNNNLDWDQHIHNICNKTNRTIRFLRRNLNIASTSTKDPPKVEYTSTVWDLHEKGDIHHLDMSNDELHGMLRTSITTGPASPTCLHTWDGSHFKNIARRPDLSCSTKSSTIRSL
jgi:hypothetical protein